MKQEIDNMFQGYYRLPSVLNCGKMLGLIGLGKIGTQLQKLLKLLEWKLVPGVKI